MKNLFLITLTIIISYLYALPTPKSHLARKKTVEIKDSIPVFLEGYEYENADGTMFSFNQVKGKVLLLDFWATWCGPCIKDHPNVVALEENINSPEFQVIYISVDKDKTKWKNFLKSKNWKGNHIIIDNSDTKNPLNQMIVEKVINNGNTLLRTSVPRYYIVDKNTTVERIDIKGENRISLIKKKLKNK